MGNDALIKMGDMTIAIDTENEYVANKICENERVSFCNRIPISTWKDYDIERDETFINRLFCVSMFEKYVAHEKTIRFLIKKGIIYSPVSCSFLYHDKVFNYGLWRKLTHEENTIRLMQGMEGLRYST